MDFILNKKKIASARLRQDALDILEHGLAAVHPRDVLPRQVRYDRQFNSVVVHDRAYDLLTGRIFVVGSGAAAGAMAEALEAMLGAGAITDGLLPGYTGPLASRAVKAAKAEKAEKELAAWPRRHRLGAKDLVVCLVSAGAEAGFASAATARFAPAKTIVLRLEPGQSAPAGAKADEFVLSDITLALEAMAHRALEAGYRPLILGADLAGDARENALLIGRAIEAGETGHHNALVLGGQTDIREHVRAAAEAPGFGGPVALAAGVSPLGGVGALADQDGMADFELDNSGLAAGELVLYLLR